jgi:hypothetical protein
MEIETGIAVISTTYSRVTWEAVTVVEGIP